MARSMTGFGHAVVSKDGRELSIELKSVNHRFLDLALRMPRSLAFLEDTARNTLGTMLARGHVDIFANYRNTRNDSKKVEINMPMLSAYMTAARQAAEELGIENDLTLSRALRLTDIVSVTEADDDRPALAELMKDALTRAANELIAMRMREGERLSSDMKTRLGVIADIREKSRSAPRLSLKNSEKSLTNALKACSPKRKSTGRALQRKLHYSRIKSASTRSLSVFRAILPRQANCLKTTALSEENWISSSRR